MSAKIIDGKKISQEIKDELKERVAALRDKTGFVPCLAVIMAGDDAASAVYVRNKQTACEYCGIRAVTKIFPADVDEETLIACVEACNGDPSVNGILVQLPLPEGIDEKRVCNAIDPLKDVDGFHPLNTGALMNGDDGFFACTPSGIVELLKRSGIAIAGRSCVVVGRSNIVGKPVAMLMLKENATVTIAHSQTQNLTEVTKRADILIVAAGKAHLIGEDDVSDGAAVIDVGIHRDPETGKLTGDVDFDAVSKKASRITPVPGGVGPMTIAMLLSNTVKAYIRQRGLT